MSDADRAEDDEPLTQLDVDVDTSQLGSNVDTLPGAPAPTRAAFLSSPADAEPKTLEPPRKMGVTRLRAPTLVGVAPPSAVNKGAAAGSRGPLADSDEIPKISVDGAPEDETTTLVGKMLAESAAQARKNLGAKQENDADTYADETATTVGDAERLIATANEAFEKARSEELGDEPTANLRAPDPLADETTARRDAIDVGAMARAAELKEQLAAEAERRKKAAKKHTIVGLGDGPLKLPATPPGADVVEAPDKPRDKESQRVLEAALPRLYDETEAMADGPPIAPREPKVTAPMVPMPQGPAPGGHPSTHLPLLATPINEISARHPYAMPPATPSGGMLAAPPYQAPIPTPRPGDPIAFAQTQLALPHTPPTLEPPKKKKSRAGLVLFLLVLLGAGGGVAYWKRVPLRAQWDRFRHLPASEPAPSAEPAPPPSAAPSASAAASAPASASAAPSASVAPPASASAAPIASASASASASAKPAAKKPPVWRPRPAPKPKATMPKPVEPRGF